MWPPPRLLAYHALLTIPSVFAQSTTLSTVLPQSLIDVIPSCSVSCLEYFVIFNYASSACSHTQDIDCLCSTNTTTGFTLGEAALRCVVTACPGAGDGNTQVYSLCSGVRNALPETHSTITATLMATTAIPASPSLTIPTTLLPSNIPNPSVAFSGTSLASDTGMPTFASSSTSLSSSTSTHITATADPQVTSTAIPTPHSNTSLSTGQIIGISMAGLASAIVAFGALIFMYCVRRKRRLKRQSDSLPFQIEKAPPKTPRPSPPPRPPPLGLNISGENLAISNPNQVFQAPRPDKRRSFWRKSIKPEDIGVAVSPENKQESPTSFNSTRTASKLLPEKPNYSLFPAPLRISRQLARPVSTATEFEDDLDAGRRSYVPPSITIQERDSRHVPQWPAPVYQPDPRTMNYATDQANEYNAMAASYVDRVMIGKERYQPHFPQPPRAPTQQPRPQAPQFEPPFDVSRRAPSSTYSGSYSLPPTEPRETLIFPIQEPNQKTNHQRRSNMRDSYASDTSFEFEDDETPPEERNQRLATVIESPTKPKSPISGLRYPKLPRPASMTKSAARYAPLPLKLGPSSSQREPPQNSNSRQPRPQNRQEPPHLDPPFMTNFYSSSSSRDDSPSSLLAKRRGDQAANIIEKGLRLRPDINAPAGRQWKVVNKETIKTPGSASRISPRRRGAPTLNREDSDDAYGTPRGRDDRAARLYEEALKSPMWEPKLTPTRRGNDLFLSVERD